MNYSGIKYADMINGKGIRVSLFVSGCTHCCKNCFNEETWKEILEDENRFSLIKECDVLIDGKFVDSLKDLNLKWKGSSNQRVIDIKKSLEKNKIVEYI